MERYKRLEFYDLRIIFKDKYLEEEGINKKTFARKEGERNLRQVKTKI